MLKENKKHLEVIIGKGVTTNPDECKGVHSSEWK
jgi:hypothetical protein